LEKKKINKLSPVKIGSIVMTVISVLPLINFINLFFCSGIIFGGMVGVYFLNKQIIDNGDILTFKDGVLTGVLAGVLSSIAVSGINVITLMYSKGNPITESLSILGDFGKNLPPEFDSMLTKLANEFNTYGFSPTLAIITFISNLLIYPLFGGIGALIATTILNKNKTNITN